MTCHPCKALNGWVQDIYFWRTVLTSPLWRPTAPRGLVPFTFCVYDERSSHSSPTEPSCGTALPWSKKKKKNLIEMHNEIFHATCSFLLSLPTQNLPVKLHLLRFTEKWVSKDYRRLWRDCTVNMIDCKTIQNWRWKEIFFQNCKPSLCLSLYVIKLSHKWLDQGRMNGRASASK